MTAARAAGASAAGAAVAAPSDGPVMPDFIRPRRGARHTLDTALRSLRHLGFDDARVVVESAGPGWSPGTVVRQSPPPGQLLGPRTRVILGVAGVGALESLPYAMRDVDDSAFGVDPLMALFDNPVLKLLHHLRGGGEFYALRANDPVTARRWIESVFQVDPTPWPEERWPAIARLLPALHRVAGRADAGLALALRVVFGLPVSGVRLTRGVVPLDPGARLALATAGARLGVDTVLGDGVVDTVRLEVALGPVPLAVYLAQSAEATRAERDALYALVLPSSLAAAVDERWTVGDPDDPPRLAATFGVLEPTLRDDGPSADPPALGLTVRLGSPR